MRVLALIGIVAVLPVFAAACEGGHTERPYVIHVAGGDAARGARVINDEDCGSCHTIPGIRGAHGLVGPPLMWMARRTYIAGRLPNEPENMVRWVRGPELIDPQTAMPNPQLTEQQARDVAAYLYTLR
jgi:cytochrome c1